MHVSPDITLMCSGPSICALIRFSILVFVRLSSRCVGIGSYLPRLHVVESGQGPASGRIPKESRSALDALGAACNPAATLIAGARVYGRARPAAQNSRRVSAPWVTALRCTVAVPPGTLTSTRRSFQPCATLTIWSTVPSFRITSRSLSRAVLMIPGSAVRTERGSSASSRNRRLPQVIPGRLGPVRRTAWRSLRPPTRLAQNPSQTKRS